MISAKQLGNTVLLGLLIFALLLSSHLSLLIGASSSTLLISEVLYDSTGDEPDGEWIEIYNNTSSPMEMTDWTVSDNISTDVISPTVTIPAGGCLVIAASSEGFYTNHPGFTGAIVFIADGRIGNGLGNTGDRLILKDSEGTVIDQMSYGTDTTAFDPACPDVSEGYSLERSPANEDTDTAQDWIEQESPDPGAVTVPTPTPTATSTPTATPTATPTMTTNKVYLPLVLGQTEFGTQFD
jgi:hypothetical protein